jgi:hypothetical protein
MEAILTCYIGLSPENLSCDGEASAAHIRQTQADLTRKLRGLSAALGRTVSSSDAYGWYESQKKYEEERRQRVG